MLDHTSFIDGMINATHVLIMMGHDTSGIVQVSLTQFYGIEINDFAVTVAKTLFGLQKVKC